MDDADLALLELDEAKLRAAAPALLEEVKRLRQLVGKVSTYVCRDDRKRVKYLLEM